MKKIIILHKKEGETPLATLERFKARHPQYQGVSLTYAGRLDPMASGVLLVLAGNAILKKEHYLALDKEYRFTVLFGYATDTHDILGKVIQRSKGSLMTKSALALRKKMMAQLPYFQGKLMQEYPLYSSKTVGGKPLFAYARRGKKVRLPKHLIEIKTLKLGRVTRVEPNKLYRSIERRIGKVVGDFRQREILKIWNRTLSKNHQSQLVWMAEFLVIGSSGTYVRKLAHDLGQRIGVPALAWKITRVRVGKFHRP